MIDNMVKNIPLSKELSDIKEHIDKLDVLSDIYYDLSNRKYPNKQQMDLAKLKMQLIKKEMLLINYLIDKEIEAITSG
jgi:hypothetical protein